MQSLRTAISYSVHSVYREKRPGSESVFRAVSRFSGAPPYQDIWYTLNGFKTFKTGAFNLILMVRPYRGAAPWRAHQNYLRDIGAFRLAPIRDGALRFGAL